MSSKEEYCKILSKTQKIIYNEIQKVFCPALNKDIIFNAKGFHHLHYKPNGTARNVSEKIHKLTLVPLAVSVIKNALKVHEEREVEVCVSRKKGYNRVKGKQYALVSIVGKKQPIAVRVIILELNNSAAPIFWSIMRH